MSAPTMSPWAEARRDMMTSATIEMNERLWAQEQAEKSPLMLKLETALKTVTDWQVYREYLAGAPARGVRVQPFSAQSSVFYSMLDTCAEILTHALAGEFGTARVEERDLQLAENLADSIIKAEEG